MEGQALSDENILGETTSRPEAGQTAQLLAYTTSRSFREHSAPTELKILKPYLRIDKTSLECYE